MSTGWTTHVARSTTRIQSFDTAADRAGIVFGPGEITYLVDQKLFQFWDGAAWQQLVVGGTISGVNLPPATMPSYLPTTALPLPTANSTQHFRCQGVGPISKIGVQVNTSSGNICLAAYAGAGGNGPPTTRLATTGSIPCPASGGALVSLPATVNVDQTSFLSIGADNTTATFQANATFITFATGIQPGWAYQDVNYPAPSPPGAVNATWRGAVFLQGQ